MSFFQKFASVFSRKSVEFGGFQLLSKTLSGSWSKTKQLITYEKSLYVHACVSKIAEKVASIDIDIFQVLNSKGDTKELDNHPALDLLYRPNAHQTHEEFIKITVINLKMAGDAFWFKVRNDRGQVIELWNMRPDMVEILCDSDLFIREYRFTKMDGITEMFNPDDVVHFKNPSPLDEHYGVSPVRSAQSRIDTEEFASAYQRDFFHNSGRPDAILKTSKSLNEQQKKDMRDNFNKQHGGRGNNGKIAIFEGGLEYQQISISQREMDFIESMKFTRDDILVAFGVPKTVVAITDDVNRANAETAMYVFLSETVKPTIKMIVEKINEMLIYPDFGEFLFLDFDDPTPQNREAELLEYTNGISNGWLTINEVRARENLPPITGGDQIYMPFSNQPIGGTTPTADAQAMAEGKAAFRKQMKQIEGKNSQKVLRGKYITRMKIRIVEEAVKALGKKSPKELTEKAGEIPPLPAKGKPLIADPMMKLQYYNMVNKQIDKRSENFAKTVKHYAEMQKAALMVKLHLSGDLTKADTKVFGDQSKKIVRDMYREDSKVWADFSLPFLDQFMNEAGTHAMSMVAPTDTYEQTQAAKTILESRAKQFGLGVNRTTRDRVTNAISEGLNNGEGMVQISDRISAVYDEFPTWRADLISRTETTATSNEGFLDAYRQSDVVTGKEWVAVMDDRTRDEHAALNGNVVGTDDEFDNGLQYPDEPNCRCVLAPALLD